MIRVTLIGPDGCGKSAVTRQLTETLPIPVRRIYMGVNLESCNIMLPTSRLWLMIRRWRRLPPDADGPGNPHARRASAGGILKRILTGLRSAARTANLIAEECYRLTVIRWWLLRGYLVIQDRDYYVDFYEYDVTDGGQHRTFFQRVHGWFLRSFYTKPHLTILLDVAAETMLARKHEGSIEKLERRRVHYRELVRQMPAHQVVDAAGTLDEVTTLCRDAILNFRQQRIAKRLNRSCDVVDGPSAIVMGIDCVTGLQTARLLTARGIRVIGLAAQRKHFCCRTNTVEQIVECDTHGPGLVDQLLTLRSQFGKSPVLIPCTDLSVLTISQHREQLQSLYGFVLPEHHLLETLIDKARFAGFAETHGFQIPKTRALTCRSDAVIAADDLRFPVFVKPGIKTPAWERNTKLKAVQVDLPSELMAAWDTYSAFSDSLIAQEYIPGGVEECFTVNVYFDRHSKLLSSYASQKMRQWPPGSGTACLARQCDGSEIAELAFSFFNRVGYRGFGYLEFKRDPRSGEYLIIEPNIGRPTGRSAMADASGVPLLLSMYCDAAQIGPVLTPSSSAGALKWIHLRRDLQAALRLWRRGELSIRSWIRSLRGSKVFAVASFRDPAPFLAEICSYLLQLVLHRRSGSSRKPAESSAGHSARSARTSSSSSTPAPTGVIVRETRPECIGNRLTDKSAKNGSADAENVLTLGHRKMPTNDARQVLELNRH